MRIGIDGRCLQAGGNTGVEEYAKGLILQLLKENKKDNFILFLNAFGEIRERFDWLEDFKNLEIKRFKFSNRIFSFCLWFLGWPKVDKMIGGADFFISPNFHFTALTKNCKQILTVHDLSFERMPETFSFKRRLWHFLINPRKCCQKAYKIWAVSDSTKSDLINVYQIKPNKISVKYPFLKFDFFNKKSENKSEIKNKYNLPEKFILFLGTVEPRKNIKGLIAGFESFKQRNSQFRDHKLVIAGGWGWLWDSIIKRAQKSPFAKDIIFTGFIEEVDKPNLYSLAEAFVYPSFYEGFGFPPLEAMASGVPTIASNCSSMPEVLNDGAILINPYKPFEIAVALELLLNDKNTYQKYSKKGRLQSEKISKTKRDFEIG